MILTFKNADLVAFARIKKSFHICSENKSTSWMSLKKDIKKAIRF